MTKGNLRIVIIALSVLVFFGGLYIFKNSSFGNKSEDNNVESSNQQENEVKDNYYYTTVDNLSVRRYPSLDAKRISSLDEGVRVTYLGSESANVISVKLRGKQTTGPFYFIRTASGKEGWVYSGALSSTPVYVEDYDAIVAFSTYGIGSFEDDPMYYNLQRWEDFGIKVIFKTDDFSNVNIRNNQGKIIDVENIRKIAKDYNYGVVLFSKGKKSKVVSGYDLQYYLVNNIQEYFDLEWAD